MQLSSVFGVIWLVADACPPCPVMIRNTPPCSRWSGCSFFTRPYRRLASARAPAGRSQEQPRTDGRLSALPRSLPELRAVCVATVPVPERCQALRDRHGPGFVAWCSLRAAQRARSSRPETPVDAPDIPGIEVAHYDRPCIRPLVSPLATTGLIILFLFFILAQREDLRDRFLRLAGTGDLQRTTVALDDAGDRLSRYFIIQALLNSAFGVFIGACLWAMGLPNPVLWGFLAGLMRFVPFIGSIIAGVFPIILAAAIDPGWSLVLWTACLVRCFGGRCR